MDVVISDQKMPGMSGNVFLKIVRQKYPDVVRLMMSGQNDAATLISAINDGEIFRFLAKPFFPQDLETIIDLAMEQKQLLGILTDQISNLSREQISEVSSVETFADQGYIHVKITNSISPENISRILNLIRNALSAHKHLDLNVTARKPASEKDALWVTMNLGKNLSLKIEFVNPLGVPSWVSPVAPAESRHGSEKRHGSKLPSKK
jgi:CheY-like chemotaxis protein